MVLVTKDVGVSLPKRMKKALITGITGFVGSHLVDYLLKQNIEIHGLVRWRSPLENILHCLDNITLHYGDLLDISSLHQILGHHRPDVIFHLAAQSVAEDEFIPILKSKNLDVYTFKELWSTCSKRNDVKVIDCNGIETEIINISNPQIRAISFFNGMGHWLPIKQISRHRYSGNIIELKQKFGSIKVTPNHCVIDKYCQLASPKDNPDVLPIRKLNYFNKKPISNLRLKRSKRYETDGTHFWVAGVPQKKIPIILSSDALESFSRFCASYIAEGCAHSRKKKRNFTVTISNGNKGWLEKRNREIQNFSDGMIGRYATFKKENYENVFNLVITSELLYYVMTQYCGRLNRNKKIPSFIFRLSKSKQLEFLQVLAEGDGCTEKRLHYCIFRYTTSSRRLASQLCVLLTLVGKDYNVHESDGAYFIRECGFYQPNQGVNEKKKIESVYDGYVYDISVGGPEVFAIGVGNLVVHNSYVPYSFSVPRSTLDVNCIGTCNLFESIRMIESYDPITCVCSSSECYGQVHESELPITEDNPFRPASPYAVSKVCEDMLAFQYWSSWGLKTIRSRSFSHTGPRRGSVFAVSNFAKQIAEIEATKRDPIIYVGNLDSIRTFMDVRDVVRAYWLLVNKCPFGEVYNIGGDATMTIGEMLKKLIVLANYSDIIIKVDKERIRPSDVTLQIPDSTKFRKATGWSPQIPFSQTLKDTLEFWRNWVKNAKKEND